MIPGAEPYRPPTPDVNRAELRQYVGAYFKISGWYTTAAIIFQIGAVALATLPQVRDVFDPYTHWLVLGLALTAPLARLRGDEAKREADHILRRIELSDGMGTPIPRLEVEEVIEDATAMVGCLARREELDLTPYASRLGPGPGRLLENIQESAWWSTRLARELSRWETFWGVVLIVACSAALYHFATYVPDAGPAPTYARDVAEFAATLLVFIFAEGYHRRGREFDAFARTANRVFEKGTRLKKRDGGAAPEDALGLAMDYFLARQASPRISTIWYRFRKDRLNAAWTRAQADDQVPSA
jgi:hypothetical protein